MRRYTLTPALTVLAALLLALVMLTSASCAIGYQMGAVSAVRVR